jgi:hypothetical protein
MVSLWVWRIQNGMNTIDDVPERHKEQVKKELGIVEQ